MLKFKNWLYAEENATKHLKIATTAMQCDRDPVENRKQISRKVDQIMREHPDTEIVLFGEMILGWYDPTGMTNYHKNISESIPGKTTELLCGLSKQYEIYLCCGLSEKNKENYHNTQVLINPKGEIQAIHRKWNLKSAERQAGYISGSDQVTITEIKGISTGIIICSDAAHPEIIRKLIRSKLNLILLSLADDKDEKWFMARANAKLYDAWIVSANRYGQETSYWNGHIVISTPLGKLQKVLIDQEGYLVETLQIAQDRSGIQRIIRNTYVKTPLVGHVLKNWRILKSYYQ